MKIGLIADIHANLEALDAVLEELDRQGCARILCAGDVVGYGPHPEACIRRMQERRILCVCGNHDHWMTDPRLPLGVGRPVVDVLLWTRNQLSDAALDWLAALPDRRTYAHIELTHSSLARTVTWPYLRDIPGLQRHFKHQKEFLCITGHTHCPALGGVRGRVAGSEPFFYPLADSIELNPGQQAMLNPGSVGQPRDGNPRASAAVYDTVTRRVEFLRIAYDVESVCATMLATGLPAPFATRLLLGR